MSVELPGIEPVPKSSVTPANTPRGVDGVNKTNAASPSSTNWQASVEAISDRTRQNGTGSLTAADFDSTIVAED
jgi:hypothetical protein